MTELNTLRRVNWLWKNRHNGHQDIDTRLTILETHQSEISQGDSLPSDPGAYIHLVSNDAQPVAVGGEAIEWDRYHTLIARRAFAAVTFPATEIIVPYAGYYVLVVSLAWASYLSGGSVWIVRSRPGLPDARVWPPAEDPGIWMATSGQRGAWLAPAIPCNAGDGLQVFVDHNDVSSQDLASATLGIYLVEGFGDEAEATACPTLQSAVTVSAADHDSFPGFAVADDGTHLIAYREGTDHSSTDGVIKLRMSSDGGATWGSPTTVFSDASFDAREGILTKLSSGRVAMVISVRDGTSGNVTDGGFTLYSDDDGATWSSPIQIDDGGFTDFSRASGQICELANGDWIMAIMGADTGDDRKIRVITSDDAGATWSVVASEALDESDISGTTINEPHMVRIGATLYMFIRDDNGSTFGFKVWRMVSTDGGATWSTPVAVLTGWGGSPRVCIRANGDFYAVLRDNPNSTWPQDLVRSDDQGATWQSCVELSSDYGSYGQVAEDLNGKLGVAYSTEDVSGTAATVYFRKEP